MKILLIVDDYLPESTKVAAKMMHELAFELKQQGHTILVVTPDSYQSHKDLKDHLDDYQGVPIIRFPSGRLKNIPKVFRLINEFLLPFRAWFYGKSHFKKNHFDIIIYYSPSIFWGWLIQKLKKLWNAKTYLILRDIFPQWAIDNGILKPNSLITNFFLYIEKLNYEPADKIGLMSPANLNWFQSYYKGTANLEVLYNWVSESTVTTNESKYRKKLNLEDKIVYIYGGNIGQAQDMMQILLLAKSMKNHENVFFLLVGSGDEVPLCHDFIVKEQLSNIKVLEPVPQEEFQVMLSEFDIGLFCLNKSHKTHNFPGKILGYLSAKIPILGTVNPGNDLVEIVNELKFGLVSIAGNSDEFFQNSVILLNPKTRKLLGLNGKKVLNSLFSTESALKKILS